MLRAASRRWFAIALGLAVLAHLPAMPFDPLFLARILLHTSATPPADTPPEATEVLIPIDLDLLREVPNATDAPAPATAEPPSSAQAPGSGTDVGPATSPDAAPSQTAAPPAAAPVIAKKAEDIYEDLDKPRRATSTLKDPLSVAGGPGKLGPKDANVQVLFNGKRLRSTSSGTALGGILTALPDWKSFFDGTKIDPIRDADHLLIAGPQFRKSRDVVVWMQYRVSEQEMRDAIETLVKRTKKGHWIKDAPVPAAIVKAHDYRRIFALIPGKNLLAVLPLASQDQLAKLKSVRPFNAASKAGIVIALTTPRNAFVGYEDVIDVPASFKWMRMAVTPLASGGADVALEIGDESAEAAAKHGPLIEKQLGQVRTLASLATFIGAEVLPPMKVEVDKDILRVNATVSRRGLAQIVNLANTHFAKKAANDKNPNNHLKDDDESDGNNDEKPAAMGAPIGPSASPSASASASASASPSASPSANPSASPSASPAASPSANPSAPGPGAPAPSLGAPAGSSASPLPTIPAPGN